MRLVRRLLVVAACLAAASLLLLAGIVVSIRYGLQRVSDDAVARFPGGRAEALIQLVDCGECRIRDRNQAVWALGQMVEARAAPVLRRHYDGRPCDHHARLCQYELGKALRMMETHSSQRGPLRGFIAGLHQPWR
jgi:hypothetical protein